MASALTIGLNTTHTADLTTDAAITDTTLFVDSAPIMYSTATVNGAWGWKARVGSPTGLTYEPGTKFRFTDGTNTQVYELVSVADGTSPAGTNNEWTIVQEDLTGGLTEARATQERSEFEVGGSASIANMDGEYYVVHHSSGNKYQVWFDGTGSTTAPSKVSSSHILVKSDISGATDTTNGIATAHRLVIAAIDDSTHGGDVDAPFGASGGAGAFVEHKDAHTGAAANITIGTMDPGTIYTTQEGATVEMLVRPTCTGSLGRGTGGGGGRRRRLRHLGYC